MPPPWLVQWRRTNQTPAPSRGSKLKDPKASYGLTVNPGSGVGPVTSTHETPCGSSGLYTNPLLLQAVEFMT